MALVVTSRNTFIHLNLEEDDADREPHGRSSSAPPTCRQAKNEEDDIDSAAHSTTCETLELDASTIANTENEDVSPPMSSCESDPGDHDAAACQSSSAQVSPAVAQKQLDEMSQMVMDIWSKLSSIEAQCEASIAAAPPPQFEKQATSFPACAPQFDKQATPFPVLMVYTPAPPSGQFVSGQQLDSKARPFIPSCTSCLPKAGEVQDLIASAKQMLKLVPGVAGVEVSLGPAGTLATITIQLHPSSAKSALVESAIFAAKSAFLQLAANSQTTYILGYDAEAFQDMTNDTGFAFTLASMPTTWGGSACWDIYQHGVCRRRKTCKWQHPGKKEMQPVKIVVR